MSVESCRTAAGMANVSGRRRTINRAGFAQRKLTGVTRRSPRDHQKGSSVGHSYITFGCFDGFGEVIAAGY
jgi:hypothetical protein